MPFYLLAGAFLVTCFGYLYFVTYKALSDYWWACDAAGQVDLLGNRQRFIESPAGPVTAGPTMWQTWRLLFRGQTDVRLEALRRRAKRTTALGLLYFVSPVLLFMVGGLIAAALREVGFGS